MTSLVGRLRRLLAKEEVRAISRRYFVSNGFDGTLTAIGVVGGAVLSGVTDGATVIKIGVGAAVGLGTSAVWSVWEIERAETRAEISRIEDAMLVDLDDTRVQREQSGARVLHATMSGLGPLIGILVPLLPFLFEGRYLSIEAAALVAVALGVSVLGEEICLCDHCLEAVVDEEILRTVNELREWRGGGIKANGFTEREVSSSITEEQYRTVVPPEVCLGVYVEGSLFGVFPCVAEGVTYSPEEFFERLLSEQVEDPDSREGRFLSAVDG